VTKSPAMKENAAGKCNLRKGTNNGKSTAAAISKVNKEPEDENTCIDKKNKFRKKRNEFERKCVVEQKKKGHVKKEKRHVAKKRKNIDGMLRNVSKRSSSTPLTFI